MNEYMTDEELMKFIQDIEEHDLVKAPPEIEEKVFERIDKKRQILEYKRFRNRVIASVAAILIITIVIPQWNNIIPVDMHDRFEQRSEQLDQKKHEIFDGLSGSHYISNLLNGREE